MSVCNDNPSHYWDKNEANCIEVISDLYIIDPNPETNKQTNIVRYKVAFEMRPILFLTALHQGDQFKKTRDVMFSW